MKDFQCRQCQLEIDDDELAEKLVKEYQRYGVKIAIKRWVRRPDRIIYEVKIKGRTREAQVQAYALDVQFKLKVPVFQVVTQGFNIFVIVSDRKLMYVHLPKIIRTREFIEITKEMKLPYVAGYNFTGRLEIVDLSQAPHLLLGGATNSGKTVGLQSLITGISYGRSPQEINFILIDVGATNLIPFDGIPHLSCPVVRERNLACQVLLALADEMERRIKMKTQNSMQFEKLPRLVLAIDEFPALFAGLDDKHMIKMVTNTISSLLQRGRHAEIHVVLAAQNPTMQNMRVDLGNITARVAFKCAKKTFQRRFLGKVELNIYLDRGICFSSHLNVRR